jgi:hypothetical protein
MPLNTPHEGGAASAVVGAAQQSGLGLARVEATAAHNQASIEGPGSPPARAACPATDQKPTWHDAAGESHATNSRKVTGKRARLARARRYGGRRPHRAWPGHRRHPHLRDSAPHPASAASSVPDTAPANRRRESPLRLRSSRYTDVRESTWGHECSCQESARKVIDRKVNHHTFRGLRIRCLPGSITTNDARNSSSVYSVSTRRSSSCTALRVDGRMRR